MAYTDIDDPSSVFQCTLYSGTGSQQSITNGGNSDLQPDFLWIKNRTNTPNHQLMDSVRGYYLRIESNNNSAELDAGQTGATYQNVTSFDSDGFGVKNGDAVNESGKTFVAWQWKAGTSVSGNTGGSGTAKSYTGSVNTDAGFSIITYTGNGTAGHTIPHHLSAVPNIVLTKGRSAALNWFFFDSMSSYLKRLKLNTTDAQADTDGLNDTAPTSSVFTVSGGGEGNTNGATYVAYLFAEKQGYSKFGSYTGNGNADGTFVYTGFSPAFVMIKNVGQTASWNIKDNRRNNASTSFNINPRNATLLPNDSAADQDANALDFLSNGFKNRSNGGDVNASGTQFIYMAFAEQPFVTSTGVPATAR
jgi:hypothetical protein